jgi:hypothetical protein
LARLLKITICTRRGVNLLAGPHFYNGIHKAVLILKETNSNQKTKAKWNIAANGHYIGLEKNMTGKKSHVLDEYITTTTTKSFRSCLAQLILSFFTDLSRSCAKQAASAASDFSE